MTGWVSTFLFWSMVAGEITSFLIAVAVMYLVFMGALLIKSRIKRRK